MWRNVSLRNISIGGTLVTASKCSAYFTTNFVSGLTFSASSNNTITASTSVGAFISPRGALPVTPGSNLTFVMTPALGGLIADVKVDGVSQGAISLFTFTNVTANHTITVSTTL